MMLYLVPIFYIKINLTKDSNQVVWAIEGWFHFGENNIFSPGRVSGNFPVLFAVSSSEMDSRQKQTVRKRNHYACL